MLDRLCLSTNTHVILAILFYTLFCNHLNFDTGCHIGRKTASFMDITNLTLVSKYYIKSLTVSGSTICTYVSSFAGLFFVPAITIKLTSI